ncbi:hypothetical protein SH139x_005641 [Planctomycetaceae bacterium SH139]
MIGQNISVRLVEKWGQFCGIDGSIEWFDPTALEQCVSVSGKVRVLVSRWGSRVPAAKVYLTVVKGLAAQQSGSVFSLALDRQAAGCRLF